MIFDSPDPVPTLPAPDTTVFDHILPAKTSFDPNAPAFIDGLSGTIITRAQLRRNAIKLGSGIVKLRHEYEQAYGNDAEPVAMLFSPNSMDYPTIFLGIQAACYVGSLVNASYLTDELAHQIRNATPFLIFVHPTLTGTLEAALDLLKQEGFRTDKIKIYSTAVAGQGQDGKIKYPTYESLYDSHADQAGSRLVHRKGIKQGEVDDSVAILCYSSGTTGRSKGVMTTHKNYVYLSTLYSSHGNGYPVSPEKDKYIAVLPFFHIYGLLQILTAPVTEGIPCVLFPKFTPESFLRGIDQYKVTIGMVVPPILITLAHNPLVEKYDLTSLQMLLSAAAPLGQGLTDKVLDRLRKQGGSKVDRLRITQGYGLTEVTGVAVTLKMQYADTKPGSVGTPYATLQYKVVDDDGKDLPAGETGELCMRGTTVMKGYWRNEKATEETFLPGPERWFKTGDSCRIDEDGFIYIVDRVKELIKYKGFQVAPADLEALLLTHAMVDDVAVIGVYSEEQATELPRAYVTLSAKGKEQGEAAAIKAIIEWTATQVANHKRLRGGVIPLAAIPKSATGKILRRQLRLIANANPAAPPLEKPSNKL